MEAQEIRYRVNKKVFRQASLYAMFLGILIPGLRGKLRLVLLVAAAAACNSLLSLLLPSSWSLIVSTLLCAAVGSFFVAPDGGEVRE